MYLRKVEQGFLSGSVSLQKESLEAFPVDVGVMHHATSVNLSNNFIATVSAAAMHMSVALRPLHPAPVCFTPRPGTPADLLTLRTTKSLSSPVKSAG